MALRSYGDVFGDRTGSNPRVLALPGWMRPRSDFDAALSGLDAIALDLPGFGGASPPPTDVWGAAEYADACEPALADLDGPGVVVGHSFGGRVAVHLAARHPDAVGGVVLAGAPLLRRSGAASGPPLALRLARTGRRLRLVPQSVVEGLRMRHGSADYRAAQGVMRDILVKVVNESYEEQLSGVTQPVELLWGDGDTAAPPEIAGRAEALLARSRLTIIAGTGHFVPTEAPGVLRDAIDRRLAAVTA